MTAIRNLCASPLAWLPPALAFCWVLLLTQTANYGNAAYTAPLLVAGVLVGGFALRTLTKDHTRTTAFLLIFAIFFLSLNFRVRPLGEVGLDWQNGTKFAAWTAIVAFALLRWRQIVYLFREPVVLFALAYAGVAFVSALWSEVMLYSAASAFGLFAYLALACLAVVDLGEERALRVMLWTLFAYIACSILTLFAAPDIAWLPPSVEETAWRFRGLAGHPNVLGQQVGIFIVLVIISFRRQLISKSAFAALLLFGVLVLLAAQSRTALIAVGAAGAVVFFRKSPLGPIVVFLAALALAILLLIIAVGGGELIKEFLGSFSRTGLSDEVFTLTGRTEIWGVALERLLERPLFGWGFNGTEDLIARSVRANFTGTAINTHNMFLQSLLSLGIVGSIPGFAMLAILLGRYLFNPDPARDLVVAYLILNGLGEAELFATPVLLTLVFFWVVAREGDKISDVPARHVGSMAFPAAHS
ncbi:O-antigen ligase family protein [Microvirga flavescens]|uniref:O-antigen ligase family protein n=1 Tax=Microvirga flavescens TaxID=2249811 RepID=UPI000DDBEC78|nr:O-antigen ligase family protein [Microvirga flavescens]